jgi:hypothetical protein
MSEFRSHQEALERNCRLLRARFPGKSADLVRRVLEELDNDVEMASEVLVQEGTERLADSSELVDVLVEHIIQHLPSNEAKAR